MMINRRSLFGFAAAGAAAAGVAAIRLTPLNATTDTPRTPEVDWDLYIADRRALPGRWEHVWIRENFNLEEFLQTHREERRALVRDFLKIVDRMQIHRNDAFEDMNGRLGILVLPMICRSYNAVGLMLTSYGDDADLIKGLPWEEVGFANYNLQEGYLRRGMRAVIRSYASQVKTAALAKLLA